LARNTADHLGIKSILQKAGVKLISMAQPMLDDSPEGKMIDTILASVNQFQSDLYSRKIKRGVQQKFDMGWWPGWAPLGYINVTLDGNGGGKTVSVVKKDPQKWELVREGFQMYLSGNYSADEIIDILYDRGLQSKQGKKVPHSVMVHTLKNPFYAGVMRWNGQQRKGKHEPMITLDEHRCILQIMESHNLHVCRRRKHKFILRGFAICNICGHRYVGEIHRAKKKDYYHCGSMRLHSNRGQNVEVSVLEKEVEDQFENVQFSREFSEFIITELKACHQEQRETVMAQKQVLHNRKKAIEMKRDKAEDKLLDGVISDADFARLRTKLNGQLAQIQDQMEDLENHEALEIEAVREILRLSRNIHQAYRAASYELKRRYLAIFWDKFFIQDKKIVEAIPTDLVKALQAENLVILTSDWC
jgi:DNA invertase Pin-like site-specific DNA recombinase